MKTRVDRRTFLKTTAFAAGTAMAFPYVSRGAEKAALAEAADKPNVIYIMADDLGYGDLGCYGQKRIRTPVIDKMSAEGIRFTHHYSGSTVCAPSRCVLMTGLHTGRAVARRPVGRHHAPRQPHLRTHHGLAGR